MSAGCAPRASRTTVRVRWGETDAARIAFYPNFYVWFDVATQELFRGADVNLRERFERDGSGFPLVESGARFRAPVFYDDVLTIDSTIAEIRTRALRIEHRVRRGDLPVADGFEVRAFAKLDPANPAALAMAPIPDEMRTKLERVGVRAPVVEPGATGSPPSRR